MNKIKALFVLAVLTVMLCGCVTGPNSMVTSVLTGMTSVSYKDAPVVLAYSDKDVIRDQSQVATLVVMGEYGVAVDNTVIKQREGAFNQDLRVSKSDNSAAYIIDLLPGTYTLAVDYDAISPGGGNPDMNPSTQVGNATVSGSYSGPSLFSWERSSNTTHTLKGGDVYVIGLKMLTISGEMDLYSLDKEDLDAIIETRNKAEF